MSYSKANAIAVLEKISIMIASIRPDLMRLRSRISWKDDGSPVTEADIYVEQRIKKLLEKELISVNLIGEESYSEKNKHLEHWTAVLDPIDGTENFISGLPEWGISISLWKNNIHQASMIELPELGYRLMTGEAFEKFSSRIQGYSSLMNDELVLGLSKSSENRISGCAVFNLFNVITGRFDSFSNPVGAYSWDLLAGLQLALEHGCQVEIEGGVYAGQYLEPARRYRVKVSQK